MEAGKGAREKAGADARRDARPRSGPDGKREEGKDAGKRFGRCLGPRSEPGATERVGVAKAAKSAWAGVKERAGTAKAAKRARAGTMRGSGPSGRDGAAAGVGPNARGGIARKAARDVAGLLLLLLLAPLLLAAYVAGGIFLSYRRQPSVSGAYRSRFRAEDCVSDEASCDRAYIVEDNVEGLEERLRLIGQARERVILSTFEFRSDESGKDMIAALLAAARRGADVKVLIDGWGEMLRMRGNPYFLALAAAPNVEVRIYNRFHLLVPWKSMGRLHDKYVIADDDAYLLGGRNTYDYFLGDNGYKNYDRDVLVWTSDPGDPESSIHQLERYFAAVWDYKECVPYEGCGEEEAAPAWAEMEERYRRIREARPDLEERPDYAARTFATRKITLLTNPIHVYAKEPTLFYALTEIMRHFDGDISIHTPYVICNEWMYDSLREVCGGNPRVSMMTNSVANNGNPFGASDYLRNKGRLLETGLTIYEYEGGVSYHGKSISIGDRLAVVGSFNMDMRSVYLDTELMLVIDSEQVNAQLREIMGKYEAEAVRVLDGGRYEVPAGVTRQRIIKKRERRIRLLRHFGWLRFLM